MWVGTGWYSRQIVVESDHAWRKLRLQVTMSSLVNALEGAGQWQLALEKFEELRAMGIRPNVICYNAAISALAKGAQVISCSCPFIY
jgi:pentatricopeptide repeat protein